MRSLGIDFGERRVGLAISDPGGRLAVPLETLSRRDDRSLIVALAEICKRESVTRLVIGLPLSLDGRPGDAALRITTFARKLEQALDLPCEMIDESLTSDEAARRLRQAGVDPRRNPERVDAVAAQILLQDALDRRQR